MEQELVGKVTEGEKNEIKLIFQRLKGLQELAKIVDSNDATLYEKMIDDLGKTRMRFDSWWNEMYKKYHWKEVEGKKWQIDFATNNIFLT
jgi:CXXX repeat modification system protein